MGFDSLPRDSSVLTLASSSVVSNGIGIVGHSQKGVRFPPTLLQVKVLLCQKESLVPLLVLGQ